MKFKRHLKAEYGLTPLDIAPLIDVVFLLVVFFMLSSSLTLQSGISIKLPKAITSDVIKEENYIITITSEDVIYLNNQVTTAKELQGLLKKAKEQDRPVLIKSDRRASLGRIVDVWDLCRNLGIEKVNLATQQE